MNRFSVEQRSSTLHETLPWPGDPVTWAQAGARERRFVWLDGDGESSPRGRHSFMTWNPHRVVRAWGDQVLEESWGRSGYARRHYRQHPWRLLERLCSEEVGATSDLPVPWQSGAILALGFELVEWAERLPPLPPPEPVTAADPHRGTPDLYIAFYDSLLALDEVERSARLVGRLPDGRLPSGVFGSRERLAQLARCGREGDAHRGTARPAGAARPGGTGRSGSAAQLVPPPAIEGPEEMTGGLDYPSYARALERIRHALLDGEVYQVNFSHPLRIAWPYSALDLFLAHRRLGRLPHAALVDLGDRAVCSFSPERLLARRGRQVETAPIKGTRPRGATDDQDRRQLDALCASAKDRAEHIMIVDLERNDLGRVCVPGSVRVDPLLVPESYAAVHHLVSTVHGILRQDATLGDLLQAVFPGGSITGAPKLRSTELIRELERAPRRFYTGAIGYWDAAGDLDLNVAIRTALLAGGQIEYRTGGGIVIDSDPRAEYEETRDKARALLRAIESQCTGAYQR